MTTKVETEVILKLNEMTVTYGPVHALSQVDIDIKRGEIVALLGPNGAGKSTLMYALAGVLPVTRGEIIFNDQIINSLSVDQRVKLGITLVPEGRLLFGPLTTQDNLELGACHWYRKEGKSTVRRYYNGILGLFPMLKKKTNQRVESLSGGEQQIVALGRGLMARPKLLLLDEPGLGLAPVLVRQLMNTLANLRRERGMSILLAEQNARAALRIADRGYVMGAGRIIMEGLSQELRSRDKIRIAYLGR